MSTKHSFSDSSIESAKQKAKKSRFLGIPILELDSDELLFMAIEGWELEKREREQAGRDREFLFDLMKSGSK